MRLACDQEVHLGYCTNIHTATGWAAVRAKLEDVAVQVKERVSPDRPMGLGLRLSDSEARELLEGDRLAAFRDFLDERGLYVFTLNGFVYGAFHGDPVKEEVHRPDWSTRGRVDYTLRLAEILSRLLPDGVEGGISTNPLAYRPRLEDEDACFEAATDNLVDVVERLDEIYHSRGKLIHVDIEPEPDGLLETTDELIGFFESWLLDRGAHRLAHRSSNQRRGAEVAAAQQVLRRHVRVCLDTCHQAVLFEDPDEVFACLHAAGIGVGKVQLSSALDVDLGEDPTRRGPIAERLAAFSEPTYLHQVVQQNTDASFRRFLDLGQALEEIRDPRARRWRIHFHVPVCQAHFGELGSTQTFLERTLALQRDAGLTRHLEIETYTWEVLPAALKRPLIDSIEREFDWVRHVIDFT